MKTFFLIMIIILFNLPLSHAKNSKLDNLLIELKQAKGNERVDLLNNISEILRIDNPVEAKTYINEALRLCGITKYYKGEGKALLNLGVTEALLGDNEKAEGTFSKALNLYQSQDDNVGIINAKIDLGQLHTRTGDYKNALIYLTQAYKLSKIYGNNVQLSVASQNLGNLYNEFSDYNKAIEYLGIASGINKRLKKYDDLALSLNSIGVIYNNINDYNKALFYYYDALNYVDTNGNISSAELIYNNLAVVYSEQGNHKKAIEFYFKSLQLAERIPEPASVAVTFMNIGNEYSKIAEMVKAKYYIDKAIVQLKNLDASSYLAYAYLVRGSYYLDNHNYKDAETDLNNSLNMFKEIGCLSEQKDVLALLSESYMSSNKQSLAAKTFREFKDISDKLLNKEKSASLDITNAKIAGMTEIERLNADLKLEKDRYVRLSLILFSILTFIALSITFFYVAKRMNKKLTYTTAELNTMKENSKSLNESFAKDIKEQMFMLGYYIVDSDKNPHYKVMKKSYDKIAHGINDTLIKYNSYSQ